MNEENINKDRRSFLIKISVGIAAATATIATIPVISALIAPLIGKTPRIWRAVGNIEDFLPGSTRLVKFENADPAIWAGETAQTAAWLRRGMKNEFVAFSANCTHLGCPVRWEEKAELFMCPCHGGVYYKDGSVAAGPPPKPLVQYPVRINKNKIEIQTSPIPLTTIGA
jgi:menaquinol-cytochrome c reductase iron-sulfur subunit